MTADVSSTEPSIPSPLGRPPLWWILIRHEWRLTMRDLGGKARRGRTDAKTGGKPKRTAGRKLVIAGYVVGLSLLHVLGAASLLFPRHWIDNQASRLAASATLLLLFTLMLSTAMSRVVAAFHERRDLDLLLSAPIAPALILVVRSLTIVAAVTFLFGLFVYPIADVGLVSGRWWLARLYPLVPLMALASTAVALALTGAVVRLIGVRRARVGLQIFSALIGASFYLVSQARQFLPDGLMRWATTWLMHVTRRDDGPWPVIAAARLAGGDPVVWLLFVAGCVGLFAAAVWSARTRFLGVAQMPEADGRVTTVARDAVERRIASGFGRDVRVALLLKEWRLILRAPQLISQILLQLLYLMPLLFFAFRGKGSPLTWGAASLAAGVVGVASTLASSLAWLTVAAEDAPDLMAGSPRARSTLVWTKLAAAVLPPLALLTIAAIGTARRSPADGLVTWVFGVLACGSVAILAFASPATGKRSDFQRRHKGRGLIAFFEAMQFLLWAGATGTAIAGLWIVTLVLTGIAVVMPALQLRRAMRMPDDGAG